MKYTTIILLLIPCMLFAQKSADQEEWMDLFNGKNLEGWHPKIRGYELDDNFGNTFRVENGVIKTGYEAYDTFGSRFGHMFYEEPFSYYRIAVEYRFVGEQAQDGPDWAFKNSGIMIHCQPPETMHKDQDFPVCIEAQLLGGRGSGERPTANLCTPGTHVFMDDELFTTHCTQSSSPTFHGEEWVRAELLVLGDSLIRHYVNGENVLEYTKPQTGGGNVDPVDPAWAVEGKLLEGGYISLQSESHPIEFRKVELLNLEGCMDPDARNYKSYYVKDNGECEY